MRIFFWCSNRNQDTDQKQKKRVPKTVKKEKRSGHMPNSEEPCSNSTQHGVVASPETEDGRSKENKTENHPGGLALNNTSVLFDHPAGIHQQNGQHQQTSPAQGDGATLYEEYGAQKKESAIYDASAAAGNNSNSDSAVTSHNLELFSGLHFMKPRKRRKSK